MTFFVDPQPWSNHLARRGSLEALFSPDLPNRESAHADFTSTLATTEPVSAGVRWAAPVPLASVRLRFRADWRPRRWRLGLVLGGRVHWRQGPTDRELVEVPLAGERAEGLVVEMPPDGGPAGKPARLRILALTPQAVGQPRSPVVVVRDGGRHRPRLPLATDGNEGTVLEISDADALEITPPWAVAGLTLDFVHLAGSGSPAGVARWLSGLDPTWNTRLDASQSGLAAGTTRATLRFPRPTTAPITLPGFGRPAPIGLRHLHFTVAPGGAAVCRPSARPVPPDDRAFEAAFWAKGRFDWAALDAVGPRRQAASLGVPGREPRAGVGPLGDLLVRRGGHAESMRVVFGMGGRPLTWSGGVAADAPVLRRAAEGVHQQIWVDPAADVLVVETRVHRPLTLEVGLACAEGLRPVQPRWRGVGASLREGAHLVCQAEGGPWTLNTEAAEWRLAVHVEAPARLWLRVPLRPNTLDLPPIEGTVALRAAARAALGPRARHRLPPPWQRLVDGLWTQAALFVQDDTVAYGLYPGVYADDVFGLEEDYLFQALSQWGGAERALALFRASYLTDAHLDKRHYLHDLRNGLTPWQLARLLRRAGKTLAALPAAERARVRALADWIVAQRARTADADGQPDADGVRVFPGLLPPFRYGGDLSFKTQSLYVNAINQVGLRAAAQLFDDAALAAEAEAYRAAILTAFDAVRDGDCQPLRSGGPDPGDYYQLMACGLLDPVDFFALGDQRAARIDAQVEREGRLFLGLPRFDGWGAPPGVDAVYSLGYLLNALRAGRRPVFWAGLLALARVAGCDQSFTFKEVGPIGLGGVAAAPFLPGRRLSRSEPCVGSLGVLLQLIRHAFVTPLAEPDGQLGGHLLVGAGLPPDWWAYPLDLEGAATLGGPVTVRVRPGPCVDVSAPQAESITVCWPDGRQTQLPGGVHAGVRPC